ncbi:hypothetical protein PRIPAC_83542 [Pristionchus pacificus]|uniref:Protein kinase domain-containing protein n=1 Tax=Pristionchus pacificus TaxID=54126 RepID=A0A8R1UI23_PRIPA|nr:hypothetical protein PRIPAC_83542 [Pristionchus pacificus]
MHNEEGGIGGTRPPIKSPRITNDKEGGDHPSPTQSPSTIGMLQRLRNELRASLDEPPIASSGHSAVYGTYSQLYGRMVAVKLINKRALHKSIADKFLPRELEITVRVSHPHLVSTLRVIEDVSLSRIAIIQEFYPNGTLLRLLLKEGSIEECPRGAHIFRQLSEAVHYLHTRSIVHRDIKPENILIDSNGDIRLGDFGFARFIEKRERSRSFCGTRPYSAPQIVSYRPYDPRAADWFSMGVVLFTMITSTWPQEPVSSATVRFNTPKVPSPACCQLILSLLDEDENERGDYDVIINSEWLASRPKWLFASATHVYEILKRSSHEEAITVEAT